MPFQVACASQGRGRVGGASTEDHGHHGHVTCGPSAGHQVDVQIFTVKDTDEPSDCHGDPEAGAGITMDNHG